MGGNVSSAPSAPAAKGSASPVPSPSAPGFSGALGSLGSALRGSSAPTQSMMGGKSSGLGQGGYGGAPGFQQPQQPTAFLGGGGAGPNMGGGKSSGLGQGGYGMAPGFGGDRGQMAFGVIDPTQFGQQQPSSGPMSFDQYMRSTPQTQDMGPGADSRRQRQYQNYLNQQGGMGGQQPSTGGPGALPPQQGMGGFGIDYFTPNGDRFYSIPPSQRGMGGERKPTSTMTREEFDSFLLRNPTSLDMEYRGGPATPAEKAFRAQRGQQKLSLENMLRGQQPQFQQPQFQQQQFQQPQFSPFQQQFGRFQQPQQQFNPFQQQFGGFQQQPQNISGLQGLFNQMMGQQQTPMQRQPMQQYQDPALQYRPDMTLRPNVEAQLAGYQTPSGE